LQVVLTADQESVFAIFSAEAAQNVRKKSLDKSLGDLFHARLDQIINMTHELVQLMTRSFLA
jgi:hypothetical protein